MLVIMPGREGYFSAGSFFRAPIVPCESFEQIRKIARGIDKGKEERLRPWFWGTGDSPVKIAPAFLLEFTQFNKGYCRDRVGISPRHSLAIINRGGATAQEI